MDEPADGAADADVAEVAAELTAERLVILPFYHELRNSLVRPERVKLQSEYFWRCWVPLLGPVRAMIVMRMRQFGYYNRQTGEVRDEVARTYDEIARSIGISTRSLERYFESEPDPGGGPFRVLKDPLLARFIRLRHQYVWRPGKSAPERTTNEYKIAMDEPLTPDDEAALRLAAARRLRHGKAEGGPSGRLTRPAASRSSHTRQIGGYDVARGSSSHADPGGVPHSRQSGAYVGPPDRHFDGTDGPDALAAQPVVLPGTSLRPREPAPSGLHSRAVKQTPSTPIDEREFDEVVEAFVAANSREASPLERQLLAGLVEEFDRPAREVGETGCRWAAAAIVEAVEAGSRYVAPRRIRQILQRWAETAAPELERSASGEGRSGPTGRSRASSAPETPRPPARTKQARRASSAPMPPRDEPASDEPIAAAAPETAETDDAAGAVNVPTFLVDPALGLTNRQLWAAVLDELRRAVSSGTFATWLKPTRLIGLDGDAIVVGVPNSFAREWLGERFTAQAESAVEVVLGVARRVRFEVEREWLAGTASRD